MLAAAHLLNGLLMIGIPLALGVFLARRGRLSWALFVAGAVTFVASQVFHIPFNYFVLEPFVAERGMFAAGGLAFVVAALLFGLSAGVFEEVARYIAMRRWSPEDRRTPNALMFGAGHGGGEAIIIGVFVLYGFYQAVALRGVDLSVAVPPEKVEATAIQMSLYWGIPWYQALMGAVERVGALCFHMSASVLVLQSVRRGQLRWLMGAVAWHTLFNATALIVADRWGIYAAEIAVIAGAGIGLLMIYALRGDSSTEPVDDGLTLASEPHPAVVRRNNWVGETSEENLEDSRYI